MSFSQIVALEHAVSGASILYTGLVPAISASLCSETVLCLISTFQPLLRLLQLTHASGKARKLYRRSKDGFKLG